MNTGGPAFPFTPTDKGGQIADTVPGMTLRDYFAAKAMQGFCALGPVVGMLAENAALAYQVADALIAERDRK